MYKIRYKNNYKGKYKALISSWGDKDFCTPLEKSIENWLQQFPKSQQVFLLNLLNNYNFYGNSLYKNAILEMFQTFKNKFPNFQYDTIFTKPIKEFNLAAHSTIFFCNFWEYNNIKNFSFENIEMLPTDILNSTKNIVVVDDFIGSGDTVINYLNKLSEKLLNKKVIILVLHITKLGLINLINYCEYNKINYEILYLNITGKAFDKNEIFKKSKNEKALFNYNKMINKYNFKAPFGYKDTASLVTINSNSPNNNIAIFIEKKENFVPLFKRYFEKPLGLAEIINMRKKRELLKDNENFLKTDNKRLLANLKFASTCVKMKTKIDTIQICKQTGINEEQYNNYIQFCLQNNYIVFLNKRYYFTETFNKLVVKNKFELYFKNLNSKNIVKKEKIDYNKNDYIPINFSKKFAGYKTKEEKI